MPSVAVPRATVAIFWARLNLLARGMTRISHSQSFGNVLGECLSGISSPHIFPN
jgi:hypothetical protein